MQIPNPHRNSISNAFSLAHKWRNLILLALAELLAMTLWFSASAVIPQLTAEWNLTTAAKSWMTMSVQIGFVVGTLISALLNLADRLSNRYLFAVCALLGACFNAIIPLANLTSESAIICRFLTGAVLAGVYPPGMKLMATWCQKDRGMGLGLLVGALTLGSAVPHLLNALPMFGDHGMPPWRTVLIATSILSISAALLTALFIKTGPYLTQSAPFNWRYAHQGLSYKPTRLANFGYLGHMWELYAMWAWAPYFIIDSYQDSQLSLPAARLAGFVVVAIGALGSIVAGVLADKMGRTTITIASLAVSGTCALTVGFFYHHPALLTFICLIWGFAVVADSAQFSTAITELADSRYVGTALTVQTCLGFLLTLFTLRLIPLLRDIIGWQWVFTVLALGPAVGMYNMIALRRLPQAQLLAAGHR